MVPPASHRVPRVRWYSGSCLVNILFAYRTITYYGVSSHTLLLKILNQFCSPQPQRYCYLWFGLFPFRSPLLRKSMFLSFPPPTKMFQFRGLASVAGCWIFYPAGCPIQKSPDQILFANPRSLSQLTTSFVASKSLGIPHTPLFTFLQLPSCPY